MRLLRIILAIQKLTDVMISYKSNNRNKILPKLIKLHNIKLTLKLVK